MDWGGRSTTSAVTTGVDELALDLDANLADLSLEKTITSSLKSAEEIERLTVDERLSDIERAVYLLSSGQEVQRISVINNLPQLLRDHNNEAMRRVVPKVREVLHLANCDLQDAATKVFVTIIEERIVTPPVYAQNFLPTIIANVDNRDPEAWLEVLLQVITCLPKDILKRDVLTVAMAKGQLSQSVQSRLASCHILGKIATRCDSFMIKRDILPLVTSLCQNVDYEVRACMCRQLDSVARGLGLEPTKSAILPELVELSNDEESCVRLAALETIVSLLSLLDDGLSPTRETCTQTIIPLVCKFCETAMRCEDSTLPSVARQFGRLCHGLSVNLTEDQKIWFLNFYCKLCVIGLVPDKTRVNDRQSPPILNLYREEDRHMECRRHCAFNFPCMVLFAGPRNFKTELHGTFASLCDDPNKCVRITMASGFHEVAKMLGSSVLTIQGELISLLKDDSLEVIQGVVSHLPDALDAFAKGGGNVITESKILGFGFDNLFLCRRITGLSDLIPALLSAESAAAASRNWRLHRDILDKYSHLPRCLTSDQIYSKIMPVIFRHITSHRVLPVQLAAARTMCVFMRYNRKLEQRQDMCGKLIAECCHSKNHRYRKLFIDICHFSLELFSRSFFKENLYNYVIQLAQDPVPNVRLKFCSLLPSLKAQFKLPKDLQLSQQLETIVRRLLSMESDQDVVTAVRRAVLELDKIPMCVGSLSSKRQAEDDLLDQKKEEDEQLLLEMERREQEDAEGKAGSGTKVPSSAKGGDKRKTADSKLTGPMATTASAAAKKVTKPAKTGSATGKRPPPASSSNTSVQSTNRGTKMGKAPGKKSLENATFAAPTASSASKVTTPSVKAGKKSPVPEPNNNKPTSNRRRAGSDGLICLSSHVKTTPSRSRKGSEQNATTAVDGPSSSGSTSSIKRTSSTSGTHGESRKSSGTSVTSPRVRQSSASSVATTNSTTRIKKTTASKT
ncbi:serine/threonine-protein phosphatase 4 regulatory subunit 4-like isoform X2 [Acanthaster planci]|uniref:Serine/threonine-protein phosphatase 4 regulatory subunit 4-like isoform X2 n=1 Tax=Acanthaster planci TaxID=133434 RepID=A0A8B7XNL5_ACAPL|nr:serine/threonine-protein phosphatase 4 regulatory subunit 4-like isoform X2 [Acanthaster planci]